MATQRRYSIEFKRQIVQEYQAGETLHGLAKRRGISRNLVRIWAVKAEAGEFDDERPQAILQECEARTRRVRCEKWIRICPFQVQARKAVNDGAWPTRREAETDESLTGTERIAGMANDELDTIRALLTSKPRPAGWSERRQRLDDVGSTWPVADDITLEPVDMDGVPGEWSIAPGSDSARVLIFFHGGGYCSGSIRSHRSMVTEAERAGQLRTLAVDYRLAPEHPFPAALEDAFTAWRFVRGQGFPARSVAIGGDSAGGGLTVALLSKLKVSGEELPRCAWLVSPWTDLTMSGATLVTNDASDPLIHKGYLEELAAAYVPTGIDRKDPRLSVLYADLRGLPPTLIQVGSAETLLDDAVRFAAEAGTRGVFVTLEIWPHMIHAWHLWNARLEAGRQALGNAGAFLQRYL